MGAGEALRRVLECLASGILMAGMYVESLPQGIFNFVLIAPLHFTCSAFFMCFKG